MGSLKLRDYLHKEIGITHTNDVRLQSIEDSGNEELLNSVLSGEVSLKSAFKIINNIGGENEVRDNLKSAIRISIKNAKYNLSIHDVFSIVEEVYKR